MIELELRGLLTKKQYSMLVQRLESEGITCEDDDKDTYFFDFQKGVLKICDETSKGGAKLSLKTGKLESGALLENDIPIEPDHVDGFIDFLTALGYGKPIFVPQKRKNFFIDGAILSLKHTPDFQYHFEFEGRLLEDASQVSKERGRLRHLCERYRITPMAPEEIARRIKRIRKRAGFKT